MPLTQFKSKFSNVIFIVTAIGTIVTLIGYMSPIFSYASNLNKLVQEYESIQSSIQRIEQHINEYEEERSNKKKTFAIGLRSDTESGQIIYVDENNGMYRAFLDDRTKEYFYYDTDGKPVFCYTRKPVTGESSHLEIRPLIMPDTVVVLETNN